MRTLQNSTPLATRDSRGVLNLMLIGAGLATALAAPSWATQLADLVGGVGAVSSAVDPESAARDQWRAFVLRSPAPAGVCFHTSYPSTLWEKVK